MDPTLRYYEENAREFCRSTAPADMSYCRGRFTAFLPEGAEILDAGCGSGRDSLAFREAGYRVTAMDASPAVCAEAEKRLGQEVLCLSFAELESREEYDGIWACASLLHVPGAELDDALRHLERALRPGGVLYLSFKYGQKERFHNGRFFHDCDEDSLRGLAERAGFAVRELFVTEDVREDRAGERWMNGIIQKAGPPGIGARPEGK